MRDLVLDRFPLLAVEAGEYTPTGQPVQNLLDTVDNSNIGEACDAPRILQLDLNGATPELVGGGLEQSTGKDDPHASACTKRVNSFATYLYRVVAS